MTEYLKINTSRLSALVLLATYVVVSITTVGVVNCAMRRQALNEAEAKALGIRDLILKPLSAAVLAQSIRKVLDREKDE